MKLTSNRHTQDEDNMQSVIDEVVNEVGEADILRGIETTIHNNNISNF